MVRRCCKLNGWFLVNFLCIFAVTIQLAFNLRDFLFPRLTNTRVETRVLRGEDFPLIFKICVQPAFNKSALEETGYSYGKHFRYFQGKSMFNKSVFGWAGHTKDSGIYGTVEEVFRKVTSYSPEDVIKRITLYFESGARIGLNHSYVYLERANYPLNCWNFNLKNFPEVKNDLIQSIYFWFNGRKNISSIQIKAQGRHLVSHRDLFHNSFYSTGDAVIGVPGFYKKYGIEISENVYVEEDPSKDCRDYPNEEYESFADCDNQYVRNVCKKHDINPVWLTNDFANVTVQYFLSDDEAANLGGGRPGRGSKGMSLAWKCHIMLIFGGKLDEGFCRGTEITLRHPLQNFPHKQQVLVERGGEDRRLLQGEDLPRSRDRRHHHGLRQTND